MHEYGKTERFAAPGFTHKDGSPAYLFSSDNYSTVLRHFEWMRKYGIDGAWLQHFLVDLPDGSSNPRYASRMQVLDNVRRAAQKTGRVWALAYDIAGMREDRIYDVLTSDWKKMVDSGITRESRYLHDNKKPVVLIWGFYYHNSHNPMSADLANKLIDFFKTSGKYSAFLAGGGDWNWRANNDPNWRRFYRRFDAYIPWNVGNWERNINGEKCAALNTWAEDKRVCDSLGIQWIPVVYPGFSWDNLQQKPPGYTNIPRRKGMFLWEQFYQLAKLGVQSVYIAMFDEVDEGTAIFKVTSSPPVEGHFVGYDGMPDDWYLRIVESGSEMLHGKSPISDTIPIKP
jgi:hypothetical protein